MSGFDEEAERQRLREKYDQNQEQRAATQRMSELLLKGATMTNSHCDACGDPLFRHDGQTFCPTCQAADADPETDTDQSADDAQPTAADTPKSADTDPAADAPAPTTADAPQSPPASTADAMSTPPETASTQRTGSAGDDPRSTARASLSRTLVKYAHAAEETDDPRRAKELLAAAREAAETLSALD